MLMRESAWDTLWVTKESQRSVRVHDAVCVQVDREAAFPHAAPGGSGRRWGLTRVPVTAASSLSAAASSVAV